MRSFAYTAKVSAIRAIGLGLRVRVEVRATVRVRVRSAAHGLLVSLVAAERG